jgi:hypothetical protein
MKLLWMMIEFIDENAILCNLIPLHLNQIKLYKFAQVWFLDLCWSLWGPCKDLAGILFKITCGKIIPGSIFNFYKINYKINNKKQYYVLNNLGLIIIIKFLIQNKLKNPAPNTATNIHLQIFIPKSVIALITKWPNKKNS